MECRTYQGTSTPCPIIYTPFQVIPCNPTQYCTRSRYRHTRLSNNEYALSRRPKLKLYTLSRYATPCPTTNVLFPGIHNNLVHVLQYLGIHNLPIMYPVQVSLTTLSTAVPYPGSWWKSTASPWRTVTFSVLKPCTGPSCMVTWKR